MSELMTRAARMLQEHGGRMTTQRRTIMESLELLGGHPTAEEIYEAARLRDRAINPSTVYRTLNWLEEAGLLAPAWLGPERSRRQEPVGRDLPPQHHHFVCEHCGQVIEFEDPALETFKAAFADAHGVTVERAVVTIYGLCAACRHDAEPQIRD